VNVIESEFLVFFDVDDTLILWDSIFNNPQDQVWITDPYDGAKVGVTPHHAHIKLLQNYHARGATIVVWSQNGYSWAKSVVQALKLEPHVHLIMSKPRIYVDDLPSKEWMGEHMYLPKDHHFGSSSYVKEE